MPDWVLNYNNNGYLDCLCFKPNSASTKAPTMSPINYTLPHIPALISDRGELCKRGMYHITYVCCNYKFKRNVQR